MLRSAGLCNPERVGLYGLNNTPWSVQDDLTTIAFDTEVWAEQIFEVEQELESDGNAVERLVPPTLIERGSTRRM